MGASARVDGHLEQAGLNHKPFVLILAGVTPQGPHLFCGGTHNCGATAFYKKGRFGMNTNAMAGSVGAGKGKQIIKRNLPAIEQVLSLA